MKKVTWLLVCVALSFCSPLSAQLLHTNGDLTTNDIAPRSFKFKAEAGKIVLEIGVNTRPGTVNFAIRSPAGGVLEGQRAGVATIHGWGLTLTNAGDCELVVTPHQTAGHWNVEINQVPPLADLYRQALSGALIIMVAGGAVFAYWCRTRVEWRWFWAGAGIWTAGVLLKTAAALPLNPVFCGNGQPLAGLKLCIGSVYCGLITGIFEIGVTLAAALVWRCLAANPTRAVAVGLGAGAFEALLMGLAVAVGSWVAIATGRTDLVLNSLAGIVAHTPLWWLAGPVERVIVILTHTAARLLVLRAVAGGRWLGFWAGFGWLGGLDLVGGAGLLTVMAASGSAWLLELMLLPFGVLSLPLVLWAARRWPSTDLSTCENGTNLRMRTV